MAQEPFPAAVFEIIEYALTGDIEQARHYTEYLLRQCERTDRKFDAYWLRHILATNGQIFIPVGSGTPETWIRKGDPRIGKRASTPDSRGQLVRGKVTAIITYSNGDEQIQIKAGTPRTGITTICAIPDMVEFLDEQP
jgi:hypothetical protein